MRTLGIIAEFNPFHNGHAYFIEKAKEITASQHCIAVMSGNYVQRGQPAIVDKWIRTKMALENGVDIVIELPTLLSSSSAESFASASVKLLHDTHITDFLCFGSEHGKLSLLQKTASLLADESADFQKMLKSKLAEGLSYPSARQSVLSEQIGSDCKFFSAPNNILAIEYLKALIRLKSSIQPFTIQRTGASYHSANISGHIASATAIRAMAENGSASLLSSAMPSSAFALLEKEIQAGRAPVTFDSMSMLFQYCACTHTKKEISSILDIAEGLENRIIKAAMDDFSLSGILEKIKTKRYPYTRLQRALLHIILDIHTPEFTFWKKNGYVPYIRILGFRRQKQKLLGMLARKASLPVVTSLKQAEKLLEGQSLQLLQKEAVYTDIYELSLPQKQNRQMKKEYLAPVVIVD